MASPRNTLVCPARARLLASAAVGVLMLGACQPRTIPAPPSGPVRLAFAGSACPRPQPQPGAPEFNGQEQEIRALRRQAFHGDFFAQLDLGKRYTGRDARERNLDDPVESAVWYELALANPDGYSPTFAYEGGANAPNGDCRGSERTTAYQTLERVLERMSSEERQQVRDRVVYILSTQGAQGFRTLARLHDPAFGTFGDPPDQSAPPAYYAPQPQPDLLHPASAIQQPPRRRRPNRRPPACSTATRSTSTSTTTWPPRAETSPAM